MKIGLISSKNLPGIQQRKETITIETPYGDVAVERSSFQNHTIFFINRHGPHATVPPHKINYLGNISAFSSCHVDSIVAIGTVGSLKKSIRPGDFVIPHDFIDFTKSRPYTFFDNTRTHVDMTAPYCQTLRTALITAAKKSSSNLLKTKGVYLASEGPRLETAAEINFFCKAADIVGMTSVPEVILAREKRLCYASLCVVGNMAAGLQQKLTADEISLAYKKKERVLSEIVKETILSLPEKRCTCAQDIEKATL